jgi:peptide deformylase
MSVSESMDRHEEGCLSIPGVFADVKRYVGVEISAQNAHGEKFSISAEGFVARIIQHECDPSYYQ